MKHADLAPVPPPFADEAARQRSAATRARAIAAVRAMTTIHDVCETYSRISPQVGGDPDDLVTAEAQAPYPMRRSDLWLVVRALESRLRELESSASSR